MEKTENTATTHTVCFVSLFQIPTVLVLKYDIFPGVVLSAGIKNDLQQMPHLNRASLMVVDFSSLPSSENKVKFLLQEKHHNYKFMVEKISKWVKRGRYSYFPTFYVIALVDLVSSSRNRAVNSPR